MRASYVQRVQQLAVVVTGSSVFTEYFFAFQVYSDGIMTMQDLVGEIALSIA